MRSGDGAASAAPRSSSLVALRGAGKPPHLHQLEPETLDAVEHTTQRGLIEFADVSYSYDGKRPAVSDLNFTALPGEVIALVGPTGAGKSTALALLHRVFDPQSGSATLKPVTVARYEAETVVIASGLAKADTVIAAGINTLREGQKVRLADAALGRSTDQ